MGRYEIKQVNILFPEGHEFAEVCAGAKQRGVSLSRIGRRLLLEFFRDVDSQAVASDYPPSRRNGPTAPAEERPAALTQAELQDKVIENVRFMGGQIRQDDLILSFEKDGDDPISVNVAIAALVRSGRLLAEGATIKIP